MLTYYGLHSTILLFLVLFYICVCYYVPVEHMIQFEFQLDKHTVLVSSLFSISISKLC